MITKSPAKTVPGAAEATDAASWAAADFTKTFEDTAEHVRSLNDQLVEAAKRIGTLCLDTYEKTLDSVLEFEEQVGSASQLEWVRELSRTHVQFVHEVSRAFTSAARDALA